MNKSMFPIIEKEAISGMRFPKGDVLENPKAIDERQAALDEACRLGNEYKGKVKIIFVSQDGIREVHTTIWNVSNDLVSLKSGIFIPVHCIVSINRM